MSNFCIRLFLTLLFILNFNKICFAAATRVPLAGNGWSLTDDNGIITPNPVNTSVPTDVYMSLYKSGLIPDPYANENDVNLRNISLQNWTLSRYFPINAEFQNYQAIFLIANGVDTVSEIFLNDKQVGSTENMFRTYVFDVRSAMDFANPSNNSLRIKFSSPVSYVLSQAAAYKAKYGYDVPNDCPPKWQHGECHANFIRKMQSSFSWDWGPAFPTMGIYDNQLALVGLDSCLILQFSVVPIMNTNQKSWTLNLDFFIYCAQNLSGANFAISMDEINLDYSWTIPVTTGYNRVQNSTTIPTSSVQMWWPNGYGDQKLYTVKGSFTALSESDQRSLNLGFRTVELVQEPVENFADGLTFYFKINNLPIFLKGSNWIPADSFLDRITSDRLNFYFASMKEANFNSLRVWGGGVYETEEFYDLADKNGIMIFQDMMFAVNLYPSNPEFLDNVGREVYDQVNRLKHRPCIIVWAGNNENEAGITGGWFQMDAPYDTYTADYLKLYNGTVQAVINATDYYSRPFLMSSPSNGANTTRSGGIDTNPYSTVYGDTHIYSYLKNAWNPKNYPVPRCCTEFGFQSYPSVETLMTALSYDELNYFDRAVLHRQHHPGGQLELLEEILVHFDLFACESAYMTDKMKEYLKKDKKRKPVKNVESLMKSCQKNKMMGKYFDEIVYLTQIHQAMAYKTETEHYRRWMSTVNQTTGEGLTMCALYWQLNDIWQAPTWASIDYGMKWKMVHYYAKNFFSPILVSPFIDGETLKVSVISESLTPIDGAKLLIDLHSWKSLEPVMTFTIPLKTIAPASATVVFQDILPNVLGSKTKQNELLFFNTRLQIGYQVLNPNNVIFPRSFREIPKDSYGKVSVTSVKMTNPQEFLISLNTTAPAPFVWLNTHGIRGWFQDNGFTMLSQYMQISFQAWDNSTTLADVQGNLTVISLGDIYRSQN